MPNLNADLRSALAGHVLRARRIVTEGVRDAVDRLAVERREPFGTMSIAEREVRTRLRARGRQLGDERDPARGTQDIGKLVATAAYEHWHRMLFARFLAANNLLFDPDGGPRVALSINDVRDRANTEGRTWPEVAARFAQRLIPQIFRPDDPIFEMRLSIEATQALEAILDAIPAVVFSSDDALGWVYQYWQADEKDRINAAGGKIGATELPAVTQLFTEDYMVWFLLHNTLGAWWAGKMLASNPILARDAADESALRAACALPGVDWAYLRFVREGDAWRPAAGTFPDWPAGAREITVVDPCMGSGHFLVFALPILAAMRAAEEGISLSDATDAALRENLFGLELDQRCAQLAAFNLALAAWRASGYRPLPRLNLACSGIPATGDVSRWRELARGNPVQVAAMGQLHALFSNADVLGSLIDPRAVAADLGRLPFAELEPILLRAVSSEAGDADGHELAASAAGIARAAVLLAGRYTLVATNVPFLGSGNMDASLRDHCARVYPRSKADLATCFIERCVAFAGAQGTLSVVSPQTWLTLRNYWRLREFILNYSAINVYVRLGSGAFSEISGEVVNVGLLIVSTFAAIKPSFDMITDNIIMGIDASIVQQAPKKASLIQTVSPSELSQRAQLSNPDSRILLEILENFPLLELSAVPGQGSHSGDSPKYYRKIWEYPKILSTHQKLLGSPHDDEPWSGRDIMLRVLINNEELNNENGVIIRGQNVWNTPGIALRITGRLLPAIYNGEIFDSNVGVIKPNIPENLIPIFCYALSGELEKNIRIIDSKLGVTIATLVKVPFDTVRWKRVALTSYPHGLPKPYTNKPCQWIFHGHPFGSVTWDDGPKWTAHGPLRTDSSVLQVAVARLLGYRWPAELDPSMHLAAEQRALVDRCATLVPYADADGFVCLPSVKGEQPAADRLAELLGAAYGDGWSDAILRDLVREADNKAADLGDWLRRSFFKQHCETFEQRPFIWHIWDGEVDGFGALVNYHRLAGPGDDGYRTLQSLTYAYLGDWITRQRQDEASGVTGAERRLAAAIALRRQLDNILAGEAPYDLFVRWKPLHEQPIGWRPDIDDGVRVNIRPLMTAQIEANGRRPVGILRHAPGIKWGLDRGTSPASTRDDFPWFWGATGDETDFMGRESTPRGAGGFDGKRWNGMHYTLGAKQAARARQAGR